MDIIDILEVMGETLPSKVGNLIKSRSNFDALDFLSAKKRLPKILVAL